MILEEAAYRLTERLFAVAPVQKPQNKLTPPHVAAIHVQQDEPSKFRPY